MMTPDLEEPPFKSHSRLAKKLESSTNLKAPPTPTHTNNDLKGIQETTPPDQPSAADAAKVEHANDTDGFRKTMQSKKSVTIDPSAKKGDD